MLRGLLRFLLVLFIFGLIATPGFAQPLPTSDFSRQQAINQYFKDKTIDLIEGIWITDDDRYEFSIVKNTFSESNGYDYIGFITQTTEPSWKQGDIKLQLKKTAIDKLFIGLWYEYSGKFLILTEKQGFGNTFRLIGNNLIEYTNEKKEKKILFRIYPATVTNAANISNPTNKQPTSGTGFFITPSLVVTNYHVVKDSKTIEVKYKNEQKALATILAKDPVNDLALLNVKGLESQVKPLILGNVQESKDGAAVYTVGFPMPDFLGTKAKLSEGIVNSITGFQDDVRMYQISIPIQPGNSGGPLLNTHGQVIGIVTSSINALTSLRYTGTFPQNVNFAMKINYVNNLINTLPEETQLPAKKSPNNLNPAQIMSLAKEAVVQIISK